MSEAQDEQAILRERARALAQPLLTPERQRAGQLQLVFARGRARYAIDTRFVMQVLPLADYATMPFAETVCLGLTVARGELLALFDLPALIGDVVPRECLPKALLLCGKDKLELGVAADEAIELVEAAHQLEPSRDGGSLVAGVDARGFVVIDGAALLSDPRLSLPSVNQESVP